jgi:hypothetical protein
MSPQRLPISLFAMISDVAILAGMTALFQLLLLVLTAGVPASSQSSFEAPTVKVYKTVGDVKLTAHVFRPSQTVYSARREADLVMTSIVHVES